jgi:hypothetical protein
MRDGPRRAGLERFHFEWTRSRILSLAAANQMARARTGAPDDRRAALRHGAIPVEGETF